MKIGILTFHNSFNCGAVLQAWALQRVLGAGGRIIEFPNLPELREVSRLPAVFFSRGHLLRTLKSLLQSGITFFLSWGAEDVARSLSREFRRRLLHCVDVDEQEMFSRYDVVVVGSDQLWNPNIVSAERQRLFLGERLEGAHLVGYALSGGDNGCDSYPVDYLGRLKAACCRYRVVSAREQHFATQLRQLSGRDVPTVLDPTLLLDRVAYREIEYGKRLVKEEFLFFYTVAVSWELLAKMRHIAKRLGVRLIVATPARRVWTDAWRNPEFVWKLSPDRFLAYIRDAKYVIAASFHGTVFSVLYGKPFVSLVLKSAVQGRTMEVLNLVSMADRAVPYEAPEEDIRARLVMPIQPPDYKPLEHARRQSYGFIEEFVFKHEESKQ